MTNLVDAPKSCSLCGCFYIPSLESEIKNHNKIHDEVVNGLRVRVSEKDYVVDSKDQFRLILIDSKSTSSQFDRLRKLSRIIRSSMIRKGIPYNFRYDFPIVPEHKFFLLCTKGRIVGYLDIKHYPKQPDKPVWLVKMIWLPINYRKMGLAKYIFQTALDFLQVNLSSIGWERPFSEDGYEFAKSITDNNIQSYRNG